MSYSRRQLEAFGEPLGESVTRLKDGGFGRIYGGGGGGGSTVVQSPTTSTTSTQDLPDWAKGYAQDVLARGQALTDINQNPYQTYGGQRVAELSDLQKTAMGTAASPEAFNKSVQGYMSPYMQNVVEAQQRAAREQAGVNAATLQARGAQSGAFGGSGMALQGAQQARDLTKQISDIQAMGSQAAYQQGVQQANTAIGQQMQLGGVEQAQRQRGLDVGYQDFLAQRNYPYQQLSYMANLVRGTPMGMSSTSQVYQAPPSTVGQIAGLGMGAFGLSQMGLKFSEGGDVHSYASGGVTSESNDADIVSRLSDQQLQQAYQNAMARRDVNAIQAIQAEMSMRASERNGLASAYNQLPEDQQEAMANGGIVAFAGKDDQRVKDPEFSFNPETGAYEEVTPRAGWMESLGKMIGYGEGLKIDPLKDQPQVKAALQAEIDRRGDRTTSAQSPFAATSTNLLNADQAEKLASDVAASSAKKADEDKASAPSISNHPIAKQVIQAGKSMGMTQENVEDQIGRIYDRLKSENAADIAESNKLTEAQKDRAEKIRQNALGQALAQFGFGWAQQASQPNAKFLTSASRAAPIIAQVASDQDKLAQAAEDNYANLRLNELRYNQSVRKGDMQSALQYANLINQDKKSQQLLDIERQKLNVMAQHYAQAGGTGIGKLVNEMRQDPEFAKLPISQQFEKASYIAQGGVKNDMLMNARLQAELTNIEKLPINADDIQGGDPMRAHAQRIQRLKQEAIQRFGGNPTTSSGGLQLDQSDLNLVNKYSGG